MTLASMTGFARKSGTAEVSTDAGSAGFSWGWELRSVNGRGLDFKLRLASGYEAIEPQVRECLTKALTRGNVSATLSVEQVSAPAAVRLNPAVLEGVLAAAEVVRSRIGGAPVSVEGVLGLRGVLETAESTSDDAMRAELGGVLVEAFAAAVDDLVAMRRTEGRAVAAALSRHLEAIEALVDVAEHSPARRPEAIRQRLEADIRRIVGADAGLDPDRLHQEAVLLASRADIQEEIDRLRAHIEQARGLLAGGGAVGRRLDFLAQEFGREANTLCAKSNDVDITRAGLDLKATIEQLREQIQNLE